MDISWPQLIYIALSMVAVGIAAAKHGQPREPHNLLGALLAVSISWSLLWWGGFFH